MPRINKKQIEKMNINELIENYIIKNNISKATFKRNINPLEKRDEILALLSESNNNKWNKMFKKLANKNKHLKTNISNEIENPNDLPFLTPLITNSPLYSTSNPSNITINNVSQNLNNINFWMQRYYQFKNQTLEKEKDRVISKLEEKEKEIDWYKSKLEEKEKEIDWYKSKLEEKEKEIDWYKKYTIENNQITNLKDNLQISNSDEENDILNIMPTLPENELPNLTPNTISAINQVLSNNENNQTPINLENDLYLSNSDEEIEQNNEKLKSMPILN